LIIAVSINGHNEEAGARPVDKNKLVDMLENYSKIERKSDNKQLPVKKYRAGRKNRPLLRLYNLVRLEDDLVELSHVGMIQISVKSLCLRSWPWSSASISRSFFGSSSAWLAASAWCWQAWW
jgi:hypothetical protein